jgi:hypothetical protein
LGKKNEKMQKKKKEKILWITIIISDLSVGNRDSSRLFRYC